MIVEEGRIDSIPRDQPIDSFKDGNILMLQDRGIETVNPYSSLFLLQLKERTATHINILNATRRYCMADYK